MTAWVADNEDLASPAPVQAETEPWHRPYTRALRPDRWAVLILVAFVLFVYLTWTLPAGSVPNHGDWWADMNRFMATRRMSEYGIWGSRLALPLDDSVQLGVEPYLYANWPTAHYALYALMHRAGLGLPQIRLVPILETALAGYLLFCVARYLVNRSTGLIALLFFVTAAPVRIMADSFAYVPADLLGRIVVIFVVVVVTSIDADEDPWAWRAGLGIAALAVGANAAVLGFESFPAACIFAFGYPLLYSWLRGGSKRRALTQAVLVPGIGALAALAVRLAFIAALPGPIGEDLAHMGSAAGTRLSAGDFERSFVGEWVYRVWVYWPALVVVAGFALLVAIVQVAVGRIGKGILLYGGLLFIAEIAWIVAAREHSHRHVHTLLLLTYSLVLPAAWLCARIGVMLVRNRATRVAFLVVLAVGFSAILSDPGVRPYWNVSRGIDWSWTEAAVLAVEESIDEQSVVAITDAVRSDGPAFMFFIDRPVVALPNDDFIELAERASTVVVFRQGVEDEQAQAAIEAGAVIRFESEFYGVLTFDDPTDIPPLLDPDG